MQPNKARSDLMMDALLITFLIGFDVAARLLPHVPGFAPVAASGLFAARYLRMPALAVIVPVAAMAISGVAFDSEDWRITILVYAALALPALAGSVVPRGALATTATMVSCSLAFFLITNFAVWAFGGLYAPTLEGLIKCYIAALPFLDKTILGDLFWAVMLFGGAWLVQHGPALARKPL